MKNKENSTFVSFNNEISGLIFDDSNHKDYPIAYYNLTNETEYSDTPSRAECSYYGFCYKGYVTIHQEGINSITISEGMYFSYSGEAMLSGFDYKVVLTEVYHNKGIYPKTGYKAVRTFGGPIEEEGRLKYIDGCTDSLLIPPVKLGDPCFNHLHFPKNIDQTAHTHPSHRIGVVARGEGECITPFGNLPLTTGMIFVIKEWDGETYAPGLDGNMYPAGTHSFKTVDSGMDVIAFHPDSDFGATDIDHPMINRTIVDGVSANTLTELQTK